MKRASFLIICALSLLQAPVRAQTNGTPPPENFDPFKETPEEYDARAQWLRDAKLGVFVHWNPSSIIGQEISWSRKDYGPAKYDQLYKQFKGEHFNADDWINLFHEGGIRYAVFVPKHHDGFCMFDTRTSDYNIMHSPFGRDYIKEVAPPAPGVMFVFVFTTRCWIGGTQNIAARRERT